MPTPDRPLYDITPPITPDLAVWPGDTAARREVLLDTARGDTITLSTLHATVHLGAHADAPNHVARNADAGGIAARDLTPYLGPCLVRTVDVARGQRVGWAELGPVGDVSRLILRTRTYPDPRRFTTDFAAVEPALIHDLADRGLCLIGLDTPSVDLFDSKDLPAHGACIARDVAILEGLALADVPDGLYELIALPLRLVGFDASPVRAVLRALAP
jgi:arylformamidase